MTIKVIGAGLGRTGTLSLKVALERLGFAKCYHMEEVLRNPLLARNWVQAIDAGNAEWGRLFRGYQATVDWPGCAFYQQLIQHYPDAKVILTIRNPDRWYASAYQTIYALRPKLPDWACRLIPPLAYPQQMLNAMIWDGLFAGRFEEREFAIARFLEHNAQVQQIVPAERLLIFQPQEGWEPLCRFLEVPIPEGEPFPHVNSGAEFRRKVGFARTLLHLMPLLLMVLVLGIICLILWWLL